MHKAHANNRRRLKALSRSVLHPLRAEARGSGRRALRIQEAAFTLETSTSISVLLACIHFTLLLSEINLDRGFIRSLRGFCRFRDGVTGSRAEITCFAHPDVRSKLDCRDLKNQMGNIIYC